MGLAVGAVTVDIGEYAQAALVLLDELADHPQQIVLASHDTLTAGR